MEAAFNPQMYELSKQVDLSARREESLRLRIDGEEFLRGPIPMRWLAAATALPGKALAVGLLLWHLAWKSGGRTVVRPNGAARKLCGLDDKPFRNGLAALEKAGLVSVTRKNGSLPIVKLHQYAG